MTDCPRAATGPCEWLDALAPPRFRACDAERVRRRLRADGARGRSLDRPRGFPLGRASGIGSATGCSVESVAVMVDASPIRTRDAIRLFLDGLTLASSLCMRSQPCRLLCFGSKTIAAFAESQASCSSIRSSISVGVSDGAIGMGRSFRTLRTIPCQITRSLRPASS